MTRDAHDLDVTVVVPAYNAATTLAEQLTALSQQDYKGAWEVIVADNRSTDGTAEIAQSFVSVLPSLRIVPATSSQGVSAGRNAGLAAARGRLVLVCDADDVVCDTWVTAMVASLADADVVGGPQIDYSSGLSADQWPTQRPKALYATGSNMGVRRAAAWAVAGWDESYVGGGDDVDFCLRLRLAGFRLADAPGAVVRRRKRMTARAAFRQTYAYGRGVTRIQRTYPDLVTPVGFVPSLKRVLWVLVHLPDLGDQGRRLRLSKSAGMSLGRMVERIRWRPTVRAPSS